MPRTLATLPLAILMLTLSACSQGHCQESPPGASPATGIRLDLSGDAADAVYEYKAPRGTRSAVVLLVSDMDVDLYLYESEDDLDNDLAFYSGESRQNVEATRIDLDEWGGDEPLQIRAFDSSGPTDGTFAILAIEEECDDRRILMPGTVEAVSLPAGEDEVVRYMLLVDNLEYAAVRAACGAGLPGLTVSRGRTVVHGAAAGAATEALLVNGQDLEAGLFKVVITRPKGVAGDKEVLFAIDTTLAAAVPSVARQEAGAAAPLLGRKGARMLEIEEDGDATFFIDLKEGANRLELSTETEDLEGDFDIYVSRRAPCLGGGEWGWASWRLGPDEPLTVGGSEMLPAGRYWIMIDHHEGEDPHAILRWEVLDESKPIVDMGLLADGTDAEIDFGADECFTWWRMPEECRSGGHLQVLYAGKSVELVVARSDSGEVIHRSDLSRKTPYLEFDPSELAPDGAGLLIGSYRWTMDEPVSAGKLFLSSVSRPLPGPDYFPPYPTFKNDARGRMLASTVELAGEEGGGTAVVVSPTGLLLSCEHVVEGEDEMLVYVPTDEWGRPRELYRAVVLHSDAYLDLSLLRLVGDVFERKMPAGRRLPFVPMGPATPLRLGDPIIVPGYPTSSSSAFASNLVLTAGVLSGVEEERDGPRWLISDGRYADGNSGSGFFDKNGVVRGIHSMTVGPDGGSLGYARPLDRLPAAWKKLILSEGGRWEK